MGQADQKHRAVLIVEDDAELRGLTAALLEEELETIECESAEAALAVMLIRGRDIAMIFADIQLAGVMDGLGSGPRGEDALAVPYGGSHIRASARALQRLAGRRRLHVQTVAAAQHLDACRACAGVPVEPAC